MKQEEAQRCACWCHGDNTGDLEWCLYCNNGRADQCFARREDLYGHLGAGVVIPKEARL